jgi:hypothetical protein
MPDDVLYIVRHPIRVLMSYWRFYDQMGEKVDLILGDHRKEFWRKHVSGYVNNRTWIRHEDFRDDQIGIMEKIEEKYGLVRKRKTLRKMTKRVGYYPAKEPLYPKAPGPEIIENFRQFFDGEFLGYDMDVLDEYDGEWKDEIASSRQLR